MEQVFVNLDAIYPKENESGVEMSFEELRAKARGWLERDWTPVVTVSTKQEDQQQCPIDSRRSLESTNPKSHAQAHSQIPVPENLETTLAVDMNDEFKNSRPKKIKLKEVKDQPQTSAFMLSLMWNNPC